MKKNYIKSTVILLCLWLSFSIKAYDFKSGEIYYNITSEAESMVSVGNNGYNSYSGVITIPETVEYNNKTFNVTSIGEYAFLYCTGLTAITIPEGVTSIGEDAFSGCSGLTAITIPESVTSIGVGAFSSCIGLKEFGVDDRNLNYSAQDGVLFNKDKIKLISYPAAADKSTYVIPKSVTSIGVGAFRDCSRLVTIILPEGVTSIGDYAFGGCIGLTAITIPAGVTYIGVGAFYYCAGLTAITIPEGVISIGEDTFSDCTELVAITIPESVTSIGENAFLACSKLTSVIVKNTTPPTTIGNYTFEDVVYKNAKLYVPKNSIDSYKNATTWENFLTITDEESASVVENDINDVKIYAGDGYVVIENASYGENISVYGNGGVVLKSLPVSGNRTEVRLPAGVYIIRCYNKTVKVRL